MASNTLKQHTIAEMVEGLPRLRVYDETIQKFEEKLFISTIPVVDKQTYLGIEVETENVKTFFQELSPYWTMIEDGSLRNSGREFITHPIRAYRVENALHALFDGQVNPDIDFSDRTSIHVHMNIRTLTLQQLQSFLYVYMIFEESLFTWVGHDRKENIFCVPLTSTTYGRRLSTILSQNVLSVEWAKYTALNLCPIWSKGTVEFRHLYGTKDIATIMQWINFILCLKKYALKTDPEFVRVQIENLNTNSQYKMFFDSVFGDHAWQLWTDNTASEMAANVSYVKTNCLPNPFRYFFDRSTIEEESPLYELNTSTQYFNVEQFESQRVVINTMDDEIINDLSHEQNPPPQPTNWPFTPERAAQINRIRIDEQAIQNLLNQRTTNWEVEFSSAPSPFIQTISTTNT